MVRHTQKIRRFLTTDCLSVFDHFVGLALKGLKISLKTLAIVENDKMPKCKTLQKI